MIETPPTRPNPTPQPVPTPEPQPVPTPTPQPVPTPEPSAERYTICEANPLGQSIS
ncbi:MAG: hypothetical protein HC775_20660 [Hyellaceae cyanobacterium CSU_1_1]|nr:hypothetical protein [Hyellaceae cyanobacterium CSU_1_1]